MLKKILAASIVLAILATPTLAFGRGGGFSGGHSFSSGSHSFSGGHSFSSGSSSFSGGHSFSSSSHSYSSGSHNSSPTFPSNSSNSHSYSSAPQTSFTGSHSYTSGNSGFLGHSNSAPSPSHFGHSYASGSGINSNSQPTSVGFNSALTRAGQHESSRISYQNSMPTYQTPQGTTKTFTNSDSVRAGTARNYVTHERYITYDTRASNFYRGYQPSYYNDCWSPFLMSYLFSSSINSYDRANWVYNHRDSLDEARYEDLLRRDAGLAVQVQQLQATGQAPNPSYVLPAFAANPDLQYSQNFVTASYQNPVATSHVSWAWIFMGIALVALVVVVVVRLIGVV